MKNIHILPTKNETRLQVNKHNTLFLSMEAKSYIDCTNQNIYITSDEEIKEGEYYIHGNRLHKHLGKTCLDVLTNKKYPQSSFINKDSVFKKIILTTDQNLIKYGVQPIPNDFLEWFVKNPSCDRVELMNVYGYAEIIIPKEEPKQELHICKYCGCETTQSDDECYAKPKQEKVEDLEYWKKNAEEDFAKAPISVLRYISELEIYQEEKTHSKEDMRAAWNSSEQNMRFTFSSSFYKNVTFEKWIEQFKKEK